MTIGDVNIIKTDNGLSFQRDLMEKATAVLDLTDTRGIRFCGEVNDFISLNKRFKNLKCGISFLGAGDFHHLCLHLLHKLPVESILVLFDHHSDMMEPLPGTISCGSWVRTAVMGSKVKRCIAIGVNPKDEAFLGMSAGGYNRVIFFPENIPHEKKLSGAVEELLRHPGPVYISIDKDVLEFGEAFTNWEQGSMKLDELLDFLSIIKKAAKIVGADVCGEWSAPADEVFHSMEDRKRIMKNQEANLKILNAIEKAFAHQQK